MKLGFSSGRSSLSSRIFLSGVFRCGSSNRPRLGRNFGRIVKLTNVVTELDEPIAFLAFFSGFYMFCDFPGAY
jgi:hypothetical protein